MVLLFHRKVRPMKQKRSAQDAHFALRKQAADAAALRRESSASGTLCSFHAFITQIALSHRFFIRKIHSHRILTKISRILTSPSQDLDYNALKEREAALWMRDWKSVARP